jgi:protein O-mannosyl-transferase
MLSRKDKMLCLIFLVVSITALAHYSSLTNGFINWDDDVYVVNNMNIRNISWDNTREVFTSPYFGNYIPFTLLTYAVDYHFAKLNSRAYHATNLILHLLNCILVFWLTYLLCGKEYVAVIVSLLFGVHPIHVEPVAWISQRKDVLYSFFFFFSLITYIKYLKERQMFSYIVSLLFFMSSCLSKPMATTLPLVLFLIDYFLHIKFNRQGLYEKIPYLVVAFVFGIITILTQYDHEYTIPKHSLFLFQNISIAGHGLLFYIYKIGFPFQLSGLYPFPQHMDSRLPLTYYVSLLVVSLLILVIVLQFRHNRKILFGTGFFLFTILPVLQFLPIGWAFAADRYVYVPAIGIFYLFGEGCYWITEQIRGRLRMLISFIFLLVSLIAVFSFLSWQRYHVWADSVTFWTNVIEQYPDSAIAYNNRGSAFLNKTNYFRAVLDYKQAFSQDPGMIIALDNTIRTYWASGMKDKARLFYQTNIQQHATLEKAFLDLGKKYLSIGKVNDAIIFYQILLEIAPQKGEICNNLALAYFYKKEYTLSKEYLEQSINSGYNVNPEFMKLLNSGRE